MLNQEKIDRFEASLKKSPKQRIIEGFIYNPQPILNDIPYRSWGKMEDYKLWCKNNLPKYLGMY